MVHPTDPPSSAPLTDFGATKSSKSKCVWRMTNLVSNELFHKLDGIGNTEAHEVSK